MRWLKSLERPQKGPENKSCWESQFCSAERRQDWEVVWEWPSTGKKSFIVKATLLPVPDYIHNNELKWQRETGRAEIGEYLMLKKMPLTGKETRRGWALSWDRGIAKMKKTLLFLVFFRLLLAHNLHQVTWPSRSACGSHQWTTTKISESKSPKFQESKRLEPSNWWSSEIQGADV